MNYHLALLYRSADKLTLSPCGARILTLGPSFFRDRVDSGYHRVPQKEAIVQLAVENAHFQRNVREFSKKRHLCGYKDHRALTVAEKNSDQMDFLDANCLRVDSGRNPSVLP